MMDIYIKELMKLSGSRLVFGDSLTVLCGSIEYYDEILPLKIDFFTSTPYVSIEQDGEMIDLPLLPGDEFDIIKDDGRVESRVFNGSYYWNSGNRNRPFGLPLEYFTVLPKETKRKD